MGTIINRHVLNVQTRMDIEVEFLDMIRQSGREPAVAFVRVADGTADAKIAAQLPHPGGHARHPHRPAVHCRRQARHLLRGRGGEGPGQRGTTPSRTSSCPSSTSSSEFCGIYPYLDLTDVRPAAADAALAEVFQVPMGTPLLNMDEVDYDIDGPAGVLLQRVLRGRHLPPHGDAEETVRSEETERSVL